MIGILGGMGPESTAYTYSRMIRYCQEGYGAKLDSDFPPILIYSMPIPDVVEEGSDDSELLELLRGGISRLKSAGASFCIVPCNTVQGFVPELRRDAEVISIVEETLKAARPTGILNWGILATEVTLRKGYYQKAFREAGLGLLVPGSRQDDVTSAIRDILAGGRKAQAREKLLGVAAAMRKEGAEGVILACTDLPIVLREVPGMALLDTADIIARAAVDYYRRLKT
jgi:aspartate racemase